jgi:hypothetical protein
MPLFYISARPVLAALLLAARVASAQPNCLTAAQLLPGFLQPPASARPWVYWTWLSSNVTRAGITADLEAMQRVGIGGALLLDVDQGTPPGPMKFMNADWQAMLKHTVQEAKRLGLELSLNNGAGYYGSGGSWVPPEQGMQSIVASATPVPGGQPWQGRLPLPEPGRQDFRDVAVLAVAEPVVPAKERYKIDDYTMKALQWYPWVAYRSVKNAPLNATAPAVAIIPRRQVLDLTAKMASDGSMSWNVPPGQWTILRLGHQFNGHVIGPVPAGQGGPETDKLSKAATRLHFRQFVEKLNTLVGPEGRTTLATTHIDSWEGGGQNWTPAMRTEFRKRRGYDLLPYLPALTGRVVESLQVTERFLRDVRQTVSELMVENYVAEFRRLAHRQGLRFSFEGYTTAGNDLDAAAYADEPIAEFWTPTGQGADFYPTTKAMASMAHLNGHAIVGAEAMTSTGGEKWRWHPAMLKKIGDDAFCQGINRFIFHRYAAQRWADVPAPGLQMGPWGLHYERSNTWWDWALPWHTYVARCQYLLRQGELVTDVLNLQPEEPLLRFQHRPIPGYDYDAIGPQAFLQRASVGGGQLRLANGPHYHLLVLTHNGTMTVPMLRRIRALVRQGAAVVGNPPQATPGLTGYQRADEQLRQLCTELWGAGPPVAERMVGKGHVFSGITPEQALARLRVVPDVATDHPVRWTHRTLDGDELYFVANTTDQPLIATCDFRVAGKAAELWDAETGRTQPLTAWASTGQGTTRLVLPFAPSGSAFIVFRTDKAPTAPLQRLTRAGHPLPATSPALDFVAGEAHESGTYLVAAADGQTRALTVDTVPTPLALSGPWQVQFPAVRGAPAEVTLPELSSWSQRPEPAIRYFSGTARYTTTFTVPAGRLAPDHRQYLDLGRVAVMARVKLNGQDMGILWKPPYRVDVTAAVRAGTNALEVEVVNLWPNALIGDEQRPEDSDRNKDGTLKAWPAWLLAGQPSPTGRLTFSSWRLWKKDDPLQESGLLGPVQLQSVRKI